MNCLICGSEYERGSTRMVTKKGDALLIYVRCKSCKSPSLGLITRNGTGSVITMGILTDLDYKESVEMVNRGPITVDEAIDTHQTNWKI